MKKLILLVTMILIIVMVNKKEEIIIPKEAIRFRVIANSNDQDDQKTKIHVRDSIQNHLYEDLLSTKNITEAREKVNKNITKYEQIIEKSLVNINSDETYKINYGQNYFPEKNYKGITYKEGYYESLVVTLGEGEGDNFWCVLFPPLCFEEKTDYKYKSFIKEIFDKIFE